MKKVFLLPAQEDWIVDRFVKEWNYDNLDITKPDWGRVKGMKTNGGE